MTAENKHISERQCQDWRVEYRDGQKSPYEIALESSVPRRVVHNHLTGKCSHDSDEPSISRGRTHKVSVAECRDIRDQYATNEAIEELQESSGRRWSTLVRHLTGHCSHHGSVEAPAVPKKEILRRDRVTAEECAQFRRGVRDAKSVMAFADTVEYEYQVVLAHANGECTHKVDEPARESRERSENISQQKCQKIRNEYRSDPNITFDEVASEYSYSATTVERHVTFRCSHQPVDTLVTEIDAVQDILEIEGIDKAETLTSEDIVQLENAELADTQEPAMDLANPDPDRVEITHSRIIRNTELAHDVKRMYEYTCQICGESRRGPEGDAYAEAHHIRPLGSPHDGPDEPENILVLCPNHHADFDYGRIKVDPETYRVTHSYEKEIDGVELQIANPHTLNDEHLSYHNSVIAGE